MTRWRQCNDEGGQQMKGATTMMTTKQWRYADETTGMRGGTAVNQEGDDVDDQEGNNTDDADGEGQGQQGWSPLLL